MQIECDIKTSLVMDPGDDSAETLQPLMQVN